MIHLTVDSVCYGGHCFTCNIFAASMASGGLPWPNTSHPSHTFCWDCSQCTIEFIMFDVVFVNLFLVYSNPVEHLQP